MCASPKRNMLWIDDNGVDMSDVAEGFIAYSLKEGCDNISHHWLRLGNGYTVVPNSSKDLTNEAQQYINKIDDENDISSKYDDIIERIKIYNIIAIDLALMTEDHSVTTYNENNANPTLSMRLYNDLQKVTPKPTLILFTRFTTDSEMIPKWKSTYERIYGDADIKSKPVYLKKSLAQESNQFSEYRAGELMDDMLS